MRTREIHRLEKLMNRFGVTAREGKYHWGRHYIFFQGNKPHWGNNDGNIGSWNECRTACNLASWHLHEVVYLSLPEIKLDALISGITPDISSRKARLDFNCVIKDKYIKVPDNIHRVVFGYFAGDIPEGILLDAFLHDTDIFT